MVSHSPPWTGASLVVTRNILQQLKSREKWNLFLKIFNLIYGIMYVLVRYNVLGLPFHCATSDGR